MAEHNRRRAFADVVTADAWHDGFQGCKKVALHVDVVFGLARVGSRPDETVRFRLALRQAEVVVVMNELEPVRVDRASVERGEAPAVEVRLEDKRAARRSAGGKMKLSGDVGNKGAKAAGAIELQRNLMVSQDRQARISRRSGSMIVTQGQTVDGDYRWIVRAATKDLELDGHPWDARSAPRLELIDMRKNRNKGLTPSVRVEVRCLREDLVISDIEWKDATGWAKLSRSFQHRNRLAAAEAVIRTRLFEAGLMHGPLDDRYARMTLAEVIFSDE
ncbi:hypothetical protein V5F59_11355 [Xanthobacter autotrophicus DSM 431]|uniref:hypothetical protein n=1 Tax=Xanthobacter nonsaccharivorans TaxID=3119912 RepID=UPI00372C9795